MLAALVIAGGLLASFLVSALTLAFNAGAALPSMALAATVYASARLERSSALLATLILGLHAGGSLGNTRGVLLVSFFVVFLLTRGARRGLPLERRLVLAAWCAASAFVADLVFVLVSAVLHPGTSLWLGLFRSSPMAALLGAVLAVPFFLILDLVEPVLRARQQRSTVWAR